MQTLSGHWDVFLSGLRRKRVSLAPPHMDQRSAWSVAREGAEDVTQVRAVAKTPKLL